MPGPGTRKKNMDQYLPRRAVVPKNENARHTDHMSHMMMYDDDDAGGTNNTQFIHQYIIQYLNLYNNTPVYPPRGV